MVHVIYAYVCIPIRICDKNFYRDLVGIIVSDFSIFLFPGRKKFNYTPAFLRKSIIRLDLDGVFQNEFYVNM